MSIFTFPPPPASAPARGPQSAQRLPAQEPRRAPPCAYPQRGGAGPPPHVRNRMHPPTGGCAGGHLSGSRPCLLGTGGATLRLGFFVGGFALSLTPPISLWSSIRIGSPLSGPIAAPITFCPPRR